MGAGESSLTCDEIIKGFRDCSKKNNFQTLAEDQICWMWKQTPKYHYFVYSLTSVWDPENGLLALLNQFVKELEVICKKYKSRKQKEKKIKELISNARYIGIEPIISNKEILEGIIGMVSGAGVGAAAGVAVAMKMAVPLVVGGGPAALAGGAIAGGIWLLYHELSKKKKTKSKFEQLLKKIIDSLFYDNGNDLRTLSGVYCDNNVMIIQCDRSNGETEIIFENIEVLNKEKLAISIREFEKIPIFGKMKYKYYHQAYNKMKEAFRNLQDISKEEIEQIRKELKEEIQNLMDDDYKNALMQKNLADELRKSFV